MSATTRRGALLGSALAGLIGGAAVAKAAQSSTLANPDAALIALCDRIVALNDAELALYEVRHSIEDEKRTEAALDALLDERTVIVERIQEMPDAATVDGLRAMARASLALAPKRLDGSPHFDGGDAEDLAFDIARILGSGGAA
jgi:hypothetical protein